MNKEYFRGISKKEFLSYNKEGIPSGKKFSTNINTARRWAEYHKGKLIAINSKQVKEVKEDNSIFKLLKLKEKIYINKKPIKNFKEIGWIN